MQTSPDAMPAVSDSFSPDAEYTVDSAIASSETSLDNGTPTVDQGTLLYTSVAIHSPITSNIGVNLQQIAATKPSNGKAVFAKFGDSITIANSYLHCFAGNNVQWATHSNLEGAWQFFKQETISGTTSFDRQSLASLGGKTAKWAVTGNPSPAETELAAIAPGYAVVMFGTNDIGYFPDDRGHTFDWYAGYLFDLVDQIINFGTVPIMMTIPPLDRNDDRPHLVPAVNALVRAYAQHRKLPLINYYEAMLPLPAMGLSSDGVHPNTHYSQGSKPCYFNAEGLEHGYNMRNLVTMEGLSRAKSAIEGEVLDTPAPAEYLQGAGTNTNPYQIPSLPFSHVSSTLENNQRFLSLYSGCNASQDESGPEVVYQFTATTSVKIRAIVVDRNDVDVDLHLLNGTLAESSCVKRGHTMITAQLTPGTYYFVLDSFTSDGVEYAGDFAFAVIDCKNDSSCTP